MRWHHIGGLLFGSVLLTWVFSGLMSMNPLGIFDSSAPHPNHAQFHGGTPGTTLAHFSTRDVLLALQAASFDACELEWRVLAGQPYVLARNASGATRIVTGSERQLAVPVVLEQWSEQTATLAGHGLFPLAVMSTTRVTEYDAYYYARGASSMYSGDARPLPALRLTFDDPGRTEVYLDPSTGDIVHTSTTAQRTGRWLFNFLHSWDLPAMLETTVARTAVLIALSFGAIVIACTGVVIATRRLKNYVRRSGHV
jgi:hypothetical protein